MRGVVELGVTLPPNPTLTALVKEELHLRADELRSPVPPGGGELFEGASHQPRKVVYAAANGNGGEILAGERLQKRGQPRVGRRRRSAEPLRQRQLTNARQLSLTIPPRTPILTLSS